MTVWTPLPPFPFEDTSFRVTDVDVSGYEGFNWGAVDVFTPVEQLTVTFDRAPSTAGGTTGVHSLANRANWRFTRDGVNINHLIDSIEVNGNQAKIKFTQPLSPGSYQVTLNDRLQDSAGEAIRDDYADSSDAWRSQLIHVRPLVEVSPPAMISFDDGIYRAHDVDAVGNYVVLYELSEGSTSAYVQRFSAEGDRLGEPILVAGNAEASNFSLDVNADGSFIVGWRLWRNESQATMFARLYNSDGSTRGGTAEFEVGTGTNLNDVDVGLADDGSAIIVWQARDANDGGEVKFQRLASDGALIGTPQLVGQGDNARIAVGPGGDFVIAWASRYPNAPAVFIQRYDRFGNQLGARIDLADASGMPDVAVDAAGNFAVLHTFYMEERSEHGLRIQRFDPAGQSRGPAIQVDTSQTSYGPAQAWLDMDSSGRMVVAYREIVVSSGGVYSTAGEYAQLFDAQGTALGSAFAFRGVAALADNGLLISANRGPEYRVPVFFSNQVLRQISPEFLSPGGGWISVRQGVEMRHFLWTDSVVIDLNGDPPGLDIKRNFVPGGSPALLADPGAVRIVTASQTITSAKITIEGYQPGDVLLTYSVNPKIVWAFNAGVLTLSGGDTVAGYEALLNDIWFKTTANRAAGSKVNIRVVVNDGTGESAPAYSYISIHVPGRSSVAGRQLFYNESVYDGEDPLVTSGDDAAIATDKTPLLPGQTATPANVTGYSRGINGIMVDLAGSHGEISVDDFIFRIGNSNDPSGWAYAPAPSSIVVRPGAGVGGSDRVEVTWHDGAIQDTWLQVIVLDNGDTGLAEPDIFYFGNRVGDTGNEANRAQPQSSEALQIINLIHSGGVAASVTDPLDLNRDGRINSTDLLVIFNAIREQREPLNMIRPPGGQAGMEGAIITGGVIMAFLSPEILLGSLVQAAEPLAAAFADWGDDEWEVRLPVVTASPLMEEPDER